LAGGDLPAGGPKRASLGPVLLMDRRAFYIGDRRILNLLRQGEMAKRSNRRYGRLRMGLR